MAKKIIIRNGSGKKLFSYSRENNSLIRTINAARDQRVALINADLSKSSLSGKTIENVNLRGALFTDADLSYTNFVSVDLKDAVFINANLTRTSFFGCNLAGAVFEGAEMDFGYIHDSTNVCDAEFIGAKNVPFIPFACPSDGAFVGWKKVYSWLVKLYIPEVARRCSATSRKCRCDKALVLAITDLRGENPIEEIENRMHDHHVTYKVGEFVYPDSFDENRWNECSHGIHFFINKQDAIDY